MSRAEELLSKGRACFGSARKLHQYFSQACTAASPTSTRTSIESRESSPGAEEAHNLFSSLRDEGMELRKLADRIRREQQALQTSLLQELTSLGEESRSPGVSLARLNHRRNQEESKLLKQQRNLASAESKLRAARDTLLRAKSETSSAQNDSAAAVSTSGAMAGAVIGVGLVELVRLVLGSLCAPSSSPSSIQRAEHEVSVRQEEVKRLKRKVALAEKSLGGVERGILARFEAVSSDDNTRNSLLSKISAARNVIAFQSEVVEFWELFVQAASSADTEHAQCMERLVGWAREVRKVKVLRSSGYAVEEMSFAEAWEEITFQHGLLLQD